MTCGAGAETLSSMVTGMIVQIFAVYVSGNVSALVAVGEGPDVEVTGTGRCGGSWRAAGGRGSGSASRSAAVRCRRST